MPDAHRKKETAPAPSTPAKSGPAKTNTTKTNTTKPSSASATPAKTVSSSSTPAKPTPTPASTTAAKSGPAASTSNKPTPTPSASNKPKPTPTPSASAPGKPAPASSAAGGKSAPAPPAPVKRPSGSSEHGDADAQQRTKDTWMEAHWKKWSPQADKDRSYPVVFDKSPPEIRAKLIKVLGGTEPKLSSMASALSYLEAASGAPDPGPVKVAFVEADQFDAICEAFVTDGITIKMPNKTGKGFKKRKAFVPVSEARKA
ncbi:uncharacterized protein B0H64DRAFT_371797 [Chaetomium fimeti]|uniref:Uncharacterized protein n=1 Tax=Chaetomium fimeti TaxID=1854472 RepID=A0AAE0HMU0_9PEZI|nr:hypothetical protein B0H64DRAFT_371797 [Chaetomium fimeti]